MALINRDPFARGELHRRNVYVRQHCAWCGGVRTTKTGKQYLYAYTIETDGGRTNQIDGFYCSKSCLNAYNK